MASVGIVSVHFDSRRSRATLHVVADLLRRLQLPARVRLVSNSEGAHESLVLAEAPAGADVRIVRHDNSGWEFGAYQAGLDAMSDALPDWLVVINDALTARQTVSATNLDQICQALGRSVHHPVIAGQIEESPQSFVLVGERTHRWVTTNCFALNRPALDALCGRLYDPALDRLVRATAHRRTFLDDTLDPVLRTHLETWLFSRRGEPETWYAAAPLTARNAATMAGKARSILQEKRLSAVLEGASAEFVSTRDMRFVADVAQRVQSRSQKLMTRLRDL